MEKIQDIYELTPMQQGILFHSLYSAGSGVYVVQSVHELHGDLNIEAFEKAWRKVVERHQVLRSSFHWGKLDKPLQVVRREFSLPLEYHDWRNSGSSEQQQRLDAYLEKDRNQGFELSKPPLMRLALMQMDDQVYQFVWSFHHLLLDGWSSSIVLQDSASFYEALCHGRDISLKQPRPYRDYIVWLQQQDLSKAEGFWRERLQDFTAPTPIEVGKTPRATNHEKGYQEQVIRLSSTTTALLVSFARRHQLTLNTLLQGAWALLLGCYSGEQEVLFGVTVSGRPAELAGAEQMVGLFMNTLPARIPLPPDASLRSWLRDLQASQIDMRQYEYSQLAQVQGWSGVTPGRPLFESLLAFENYHVDALVRKQSVSLKISRSRFIERTNYPITVVAVPGSELTLGILFDASRFEAAAITRMLAHIESLLEQIISDPDKQLVSVSPLTVAERREILSSWNDTAVSYPRNKCVHELIEYQAEQNPDAIAAVFEGEHLTYEHLNQRANQLARHLLRLGIGTETVVGICMERSLDMIVGLVGVFKAGAAYLPMDPAYPKERLAFALEDSRAAAFLTQQWLAEQMPDHTGKLVLIDSDWDAIASQGQGNPAIPLTADNLAYVIYTSGSSGKPKGVEISHAGLLNLVFWHQQTYSIKPADRASQIAGTGFDASVWEIWPYLSAGASIHLTNEQTRSTPSMLLDWLIEQAITISFLPTPLAEILLSAEWPKPTALETLLTGGDKLRHYPSPSLCFALVNHYGPTESTVVASCAAVPPALHDEHLPTIGRPIANTQIYILDSQMRAVPVGVSGELHIGGNSLARGYRDRPELTAEKFIPSPFSGGPGARVYKTGDRARFLADGEIEILERLDDQVKIRGFRVEPGEIEARLNQHTAVQESLVLTREGQNGDKRLVAYLVLRRESTATGSEFRNFLLDRLPNYMIPSAFVMLDTFPLTPNGKVDRRALLEMGSPEPAAEATYTEPGTDLEKSIASVWQEVLGLDRVGAHQNFFELGGHSLTMVQVHNKLREKIDADLSIIEMFKYPTINSLVHFLSRHHAKEPALLLEEGEIAKLDEGKARMRLLRQRQQPGSEYRGNQDE